jgi:hypothetical protein
MRLSIRAPFVAASDPRRAVMVSRDQAYYWTPAWQKEERAAHLDLIAGRVHSFSNASDALAWLTSDDE